MSAKETQDAIQFLFGVEDSSKLFDRLQELHDLTYALTTATDEQKQELVYKIKDWYKLCDF